MAQLVEALHYQPEGRGFNPRSRHWDFSLTYPAGSVFDSACNRNERQNYLLGRCVGLTTFLTSCADCIEILGAQLPGALRTCRGIDVFRSHVVSRPCCTSCGYVQDVSPRRRWRIHCQTWEERILAVVTACNCCELDNVFCTELFSERNFLLERSVL